MFRPSLFVSSKWPHYRAIFCSVLCVLIAGCAGYVPPKTTSTPGASGSIALSTSSFNFKSVVVGQTATQTLTISNSGQSPVQLTSLSVSNKQFTITGPAVPLSIAPSASLSYTLSFSPAAVGSVTGMLTVGSNAKTAPGPVSLSGSGEKAVANLVFSPASINFGNITLKSTATQNVVMQNTGNTSITVQGITVAGAGFGYSSISPGFTLAPLATAMFQVWFAPKTEGAASATVSVISPNLSSPETLSASGNGMTSGSTPPPAPPTTPHSVHLTWSASASQIAGYRVYRSESSGGS